MSEDVFSRALRLRFIDWQIFSRAPTFKRIEKYSSGFLVERALYVSIQTLSLLKVSISPEELIFFISSNVFFSILKSKNLSLDANLATLRTRRGSSSKEVETLLSNLFLISSIPPYGSIKLPPSSSAIALIVRSRLSKSSSRVTEESNLNSKPLCPRAVFRSCLARAYSSLVSGCKKTGKSLPIFLYPLSISSFSDAPTTTQSLS